MTRLHPSDHAGLPKTGKLTPARKREIAGWRLNLVAEVAICEYCNRTYSLACHEIARGCDRHKAVMERCCILVLCNDGHGTRPSCHTTVGAWDRAKQLALLLIRRGGDFDLARYHAVIGRNKPDQADVDGWVRNLAELVRNPTWR